MSRMLKLALRDTLDTSEINELYSSFDNIGDIIIIKIPDALSKKKD